MPLFNIFSSAYINVCIHVTLAHASPYSLSLNYCHCLLNTYIVNVKKLTNLVYCNAVCSLQLFLFVGVLVGCPVNGNCIHYFHGSFHKMLCCSYTFIKSKEASCKKVQ